MINHTINAVQDPYRMVSRTTLLLLLGFTLFLLTFPVSAKTITDDQKIIYIDDQIRFADGLVSRGHHDLAIAEYLRLTEKFANDPLVAEAWVQLAEAYAAKKDFKKAFAAFNTFFTKFSKSRILPAAHLKYALVLYKTGIEGNKTKALDLLNKLKSQSANPVVIQDAAGFHLGKLYLAEKRDAEAFSEFNIVASKKIEKSPQDDFRVTSLIELVKIHKQRKEGAEALRLLSGIINNSNLSQELSLRLHWLTGELYFDAAQYQKAADVFAKLAILFSKSPVAKDAIYKRLQAIYMLKDYAKVISEIDRLIKNRQIADSGWERFYLMKASSLSNLNFKKKAIESLKSVMSKSKESAMLQFAAYKYVEIQLQQGELRSALNLMNQYIEKPSFSRDGVRDMVVLITDYCGADEGEKLLRKAIKTIPANSKNVTLLNLKLAALLIKAGKADEALNLYRSIAEEDLKEFLPYALMGEAQALEKMRKIEDAAAKYKLLIKTFPQSELYSEAMLRIGVMFLADKKQWNTSMVYFSEVIKRFPEKPVAMLATFYQGYLAFYKKDYKTAKQILAKLRNRKQLTPDLHQDVKIYLLWTLLRLKEIDASILIFNSTKNQGRLLAHAVTSFVNELGTALIKKNPSAAQLCFNELLRRQQRQAQQLGYIGLSAIAMQKGDAVKGIELLRKSVKLQGDLKTTTEAILLLGNLLVERGKDQEAVLVFEQSLDNPYNKKYAAAARLGLAKILAKQDDRLKTANRYAMSVFILSQDKKICSEAMLLSVQISLKMKDKKAAQTTWREFQTRFPELTKTPEAQKIAIQLKK